jgi:hypothetical protein
MCSKVLVHLSLRHFNCSSVFPGFDPPALRYSLLFVRDLERDRCKEWSRQDPQLGKVKRSWFSVHVPDELTSFKNNKQKRATSRLTKYRNQGKQRVTI